MPAWSALLIAMGPGPTSPRWLSAAAAVHGVIVGVAFVADIEASPQGSGIESLRTSSNCASIPRLRGFADMAFCAELQALVEAGTVAGLALDAPTGTLTVKLDGRAPAHLIRGIVLAAAELPDQVVTTIEFGAAGNVTPGIEGVVDFRNTTIEKSIIFREVRFRHHDIRQYPSLFRIRNDDDPSNATLVFAGTPVKRDLRPHGRTRLPALFRAGKTMTTMDQASI